MWFNSPRDATKLPSELFRDEEPSITAQDVSPDTAMGDGELDGGAAHACSEQNGGALVREKSILGSSLDTAAVLVCVSFVLSLAGGASAS